VVNKRQSWNNADPKKTVDNLIHSFYTAIPTEGTDIVIGIVNPRTRRGRDGMSFYQEGYILVRYLENQNRLEKVLKHEIAHLFGATHVDDKTSLMDNNVGGSHLDRTNKTIIKLHRHRKFKESGFPISAEVCNRLLPLYRKIAKENEALKRSGIPFLKRKSLKSRLCSKKNRVARGGDSYAVKVTRTVGTSSFASRNMGWLGTVIFIFILLHMYQFWLQMKLDYLPYQTIGGEQVKNLYAPVEAVFANPVFVLIYVVSMVVIAFHLWHGFQSAFQTLGINHKKYTPVIKFLGKTYSVIIPLGFAIIPLIMFLKS